jgi:hypothetical protein
MSLIGCLANLQRTTLHAKQSAGCKNVDQLSRLGKL